MNVVLLLFTMISILGCMNVKTINLRKHNFNERPQHIIWFMIPGLHEEHLGLLKTNPSPLYKKNHLESGLCFGKLWNFNLFELRPHSSLGHLSQATGTKNVSNFCNGLKQGPVWSVFSKIGHKSVILESAISRKYSFELSQSQECNHGSFLSKTSLIRMHQGEGKEFHYQREIIFNEGDIFYDKSCQKDICFASFSENAKAIWKKMQTYENVFFVLRIGNYGNAIENKKIFSAKKILAEIDELIGYFLKETNSQSLVIVSSSGAKNFEFPKKGRSWGKFQNRGKNVIYKRTSLMSPIWASGSGAENFCGIYDESDVFNRILWRPKRNFFEENILQRLTL